jgi:hypothetical protein
VFCKGFLISVIGLCFYRKLFYQRKGNIEKRKTSQKFLLKECEYKNKSRIKMRDAPLSLDNEKCNIIKNKIIFYYIACAFHYS